MACGEGCWMGGRGGGGQETLSALSYWCCNQGDQSHSVLWCHQVHYYASSFVRGLLCLRTGAQGEMWFSHRLLEDDRATSIISGVNVWTNMWTFMLHFIDYCNVFVTCSISRPCQKNPISVKLNNGTFTFVNNWLRTTPEVFMFK